MIRAIDVDGDGDLDLVTGSGGNPTIIEIYQNGFNGTHEAFATVPGQTLSLDDSESAAGYRSVSLGDQDDDGDVDMALGLYDNRYVFIRNLSGLDGLEIPNPSVEVSRDDPQDIDGITSTAIGNFGDGTGPDAFGDLVMVSSPGFRAENQPPDRLLYARGDGASSFASPVELLRTGTDEYLGWVSKADLNGDQYDDIVFKVQTATGENIVRAALGSADGPVIQAGEGSSISVYGAQQPAPGDFNGDGDQDVAIPSSSMTDSRLVSATAAAGWLSTSPDRSPWRQSTRLTSFPRQAPPWTPTGTAGSTSRRPAAIRVMRIRLAASRSC